MAHLPPDPRGRTGEARAYDARGDARGDAVGEPGMPRWVKVSGIVVVVLILLLGGLKLLGVGGEHGPGRHAPSGGNGGQEPPSGVAVGPAPPEGVYRPS